MEKVTDDSSFRNLEGLVRKTAYDVTGPAISRDIYGKTKTGDDDPYHGTGIEEGFQELAEDGTYLFGRAVYNVLSESDEKKPGDGKRLSKESKKTGRRDTEEERLSRHEKDVSRREGRRGAENGRGATDKRAAQKRHNRKIHSRSRNMEELLSDAEQKAAALFAKDGVKAAAVSVIPVLMITVFIVVFIFIIMAAMGAVAGSMVEHTSYQAGDETLLLSNKVFHDLEKADRNAVRYTEVRNVTASDGGGYDEYIYLLDGDEAPREALVAALEHDGHLLAAYLSSKYFDYTLTDAISREIEDIYGRTFVLRQYEVLEERTECYEDEDGKVHYWNGSGYQLEECTYRYAAFVTSLEARSLDEVLKESITDEEQERFYELYKDTKGHKEYLFGGYSARDDIYRYEYDPEEYRAIYGDADVSFSDEEAQHIYDVAQTQLGKAYKWGGSKPETGFDCSGYITWVMNTSGAAHIPRTSANAILEGFCDKVGPSEARPGDLVFFQGTYATKGASHVGIYLGNDRMIHCGDPIKVTNISTQYWRSHFYHFGRIKDDFRT